MTGLASTLFSIAMLAALLLLVVGVRLALRPASRKQGGLMVVLSAILLANVAVWSL